MPTSSTSPFQVSPFQNRNNGKTRTLDEVENGDSCAAKNVQEESLVERLAAMANKKRTPKE